MRQRGTHDGVSNIQNTVLKQKRNLKQATAPDSRRGLVGLRNVLPKVSSVKLDVISGTSDHVIF